MLYVHKRTSTRTGTPLSGGTRLSHALIMYISLSFRRFTHTVQSSSCSSVTGSGGNVLAKPCSVCNVLHVQAYNDTKESFFFLLVLRFVALADERKPHAGLPSPSTRSIIRGHIRSATNTESIRGSLIDPSVGTVGRLRAFSCSERAAVTQNNEGNLE